MTLYRRVLVAMAKEPWTPGAGTSKIEDGYDAWIELHRLLAPHLANTLLIIIDQPVHAIPNYRGKLTGWNLDYEFDQDYWDELRDVTPEHELECELCVERDGVAGVFRMTDMPRELFFSAVVTPQGDWRDIPQDADDEYGRRVLDEFRDCLGVVVVTLS